MEMRGIDSRANGKSKMFSRDQACFPGDALNSASGYKKHCSAYI